MGTAGGGGALLLAAGMVLAIVRNRGSLHCRLGTRAAQRTLYNQDAPSIARSKESNKTPPFAAAAATFIGAGPARSLLVAGGGGCAPLLPPPPPCRGLGAASWASRPRSSSHGPVRRSKPARMSPQLWTWCVKPRRPRAPRLSQAYLTCRACGPQLDMLVQTVNAQRTMQDRLNARADAVCVRHTKKSGA